MSRRRLVEAAFLLPWVGAFLLTPPLVVILQTWSRVAGFPLFIIYVFVCWIALILAGRLLTSRLARMEDEERLPGKDSSRPNRGPAEGRPC